MAAYLNSFRCACSTVTQLSLQRVGSAEQQAAYLKHFRCARSFVEEAWQLADAGASLCNAAGRLSWLCHGARMQPVQTSLQVPMKLPSASCKLTPG